MIIAPQLRRPRRRLTIHAAADAVELGTVLGVWAHPDDEAYLASGLMALARQAGSRVVCVTATRGEHGTDDPVRWPPSRLARTRVAELTAAMAVLGIDEHRWLDFEDGTLDTVEVARGAAIVEDLLGELRPDTVVTFGPDGMTGHPDHCAISTWVHRAWRRTGSTARLLWATTTAAFADEFADVHDALGIFPPGLPWLAEPEDITVTVELDEDCADLKLAALRTYATQLQPVLDVIGADGLRRWRQTETFREPPSA